MLVKTKTLIVIALTVVALIAWDVYAILAGGQEATISWQMIDLGYKFPAISFSMGFLMGHFFWRARNPNDVDKK